MAKTFQVHLALTNESLHRRNIVHHGLTTLRPTICHGMLREASVEFGDIVLDPMAGCGSIPIEGLIYLIFSKILNYKQGKLSLKMWKLLCRCFNKYRSAGSFSWCATNESFEMTLELWFKHG